MKFYFFYHNRLIQHHLPDQKRIICGSWADHRRITLDHRYYAKTGKLEVKRQKTRQNSAPTCGGSAKVDQVITQKNKFSKVNGKGGDE